MATRVAAGSLFGQISQPASPPPIGSRTGLRDRCRMTNKWSWRMLSRAEEQMRSCPPACHIALGFEPELHSGVVEEVMDLAGLPSARANVFFAGAAVPLGTTPGEAVLTVFQKAPPERTPKRTPTVFEPVGGCWQMFAFVGLILSLLCVVTGGANGSQNWRFGKEPDGEAGGFYGGVCCFRA